MSEYPSERQIGELKDKAREIPIQYDAVMDIVRDLWDYDYGQIIEDHLVMSQPGIGHTLITGGWSGNEDILSALSGSMFDMIHWYSSERGGKHVYRREM